MDQSCDVLCVGLIVADLVCAPIAQFPPAGGLVTTQQLELTIGGCASNVAVDLARLNVAVGIAGRVGADPLGEFVQAELHRAHVSCAHVTVSQTAQTAATQVVNVQGEDRRFIHAVGANAELTGLELSDDALTGVRILYVGGFGLNSAFSGEHVAALFRRARQLGVTTVLDVVIGEPDLIRAMLPAALAETDLFLPNRDEGEVITGLDDPWAQARHFRKLGAGDVIVTCGAQGVVVLDRDGRTLRAPAHPVRQVDGTGGGDAFVAGYLYGRLRERSVEQCLSLGSAMGASCVQSAGATTGVFREAELLAYVAEHPLEILVEHRRSEPA
ncbi:MAG: carbohydrate kinase family protein [Planctomycetaceae bacterium]|nr:carbohydrate kinase family protein [Planctomycetaceae bacterium]